MLLGGGFTVFFFFFKKGPKHQAEVLVPVSKHRTAVICMEEKTFTFFREAAFGPVSMSSVSTNQKYAVKNVPLNKNILKTALAGVAQWIESRPANQRVTSLIPSQGTCLGCRPGPQ